MPAELPDPADAPAEATARLRLDLSYDGTDFHGWATQPGQRTVQGELEAGLARVTRTSVKVTVAGRTDAGVHARGQVCHLDLPQFVLASLPGRSERSPAAALVTRLAGVLPRDIVVHMAREVTSDFDARFGAQWRRYRYRISDSPAVHDPLRRDVLRHRRPLDVAAMARASAGLLGEHDFLSFCRPREGGTTVRELRELRWERPGEGRADEGLVVATVVADAFCHHMVRSLVGALSVEPLPAEDAAGVERYSRGIIARLFDSDMARIAAELHSRLQRTDPGDLETSSALLNQLQILEQQRARIRQLM